MTISKTEAEIVYLIKKHHVYGAETIINAVVLGSIGEAYIDKDVLKRMIDRAYDRFNREVEA